MLYDEIIKIVTLAGELMLQAQDEELTVFDKEGTANFGISLFLQPVFCQTFLRKHCMKY